jgi:uncharacterized protein
VASILPFALSVSKPVLSDAAGVEGGPSSLRQRRKRGLRQAQPERGWFWGLLGLFLLLLAAPAAAIDFPPLTGRVVDAANIIPDDAEARLTTRLEALQQQSSRQLVVATVPSLQDQPVEDYANALFREWRLGQSEADNGILLLVAPAEHKVRIEVGYGLEPIVTDALSSQIIRNTIIPHFKQDDYAGGIAAGADALIQQLQAPPEAAEQRALAAQQAENRHRQRGHGGSAAPVIFWVIIVMFVVLPMLGGALGGRRYRRGVSIWGPGTPYRHRGGGSGLGWMLLGMALSNIGRGGGSSWGGGGSSWGGGGGSWGGGGFSGGGGSSGGGGASGSW